MLPRFGARASNSSKNTIGKEIGYKIGVLVDPVLAGFFYSELPERKSILA